MSRIYAISDIHGFYEEMKESLKLVDLDTNKNDKLIFLGDYIDGGTKSCQVLYHIKELEEKYPNQVIILFGNHEQMFIDWYTGEDLIQWLGQDQQLTTIKSFFSSEQFDSLTKEISSQNNSYNKMSILIKNELKKNHIDLLKWLKLKSNSLYYETTSQIFVHAGICEIDEELWKYSTRDDEFIWKFPAETGYFYKDIIAGHISSAIVSNDENYLGKVYWDKQSHFFVDGETIKSGIIPLLKYDTEKSQYSSYKYDDDGLLINYKIRSKNS